MLFGEKNWKFGWGMSGIYESSGMGIFIIILIIFYK